MNTNMEYRHYLINNANNIISQNSNNLRCNSILVNYNNIKVRDIINSENIKKDDNPLRNNYLNLLERKKNNNLQFIFNNQ